MIQIGGYQSLDVLNERVRVCQIRNYGWRWKKDDKKKTKTETKQNTISTHTNNL